MSRPPLPPLTTFKARWRDQIFADHELSYSTFKLGYCLADFCTMPSSATKYRKQGKVFVWPSQKTLHERTTLNIDTIRVAVKQLIERGHLRRVKRGNQHDGSNKYRLLVRKASESDRADRKSR